MRARPGRRVLRSGTWGSGEMRGGGIARRRPCDHGLHRMRFVGAREGVHAFAVKRKRTWRYAPPTRAAPQRYGGRSRSRSETGLQSRRTCHWKLALPGRSPGSIPQPGYRPTSGRSLVLRHVARVRGEAGRVPLSGPLTMANFRNGLRTPMAVPCLFLLALPCPPRRRPARSRHHHRHPRAAGARAAAAPTSSSSTPKPSAQHGRFGRDPRAALRACRSRATAAPARPRAISSAAPARAARGAGRRRARRLGHARPGRVRGLSLAQIDRIEVLRGPRPASTAPTAWAA